MTERPEITIMDDKLADDNCGYAPIEQRMYTAPSSAPIEEEDPLVCILYNAVPKGHMFWEDDVKRHRLVIIEVERSWGQFKLQYRVHIVHSEHGNRLDIQEIVHDASRRSPVSVKVVEMTPQSMLSLGRGTAPLVDSPYHFHPAFLGIVGISSALNQWAFEHSVFKAAENATVLTL